MDPQTKGVADKIAAAKLWLISEGSGDDGPRNLPYRATALYALILVPNDEVERVSADEHWRLYANPTWVLAAAVSEVAAEVLHCTWHLLLEHADRAHGMQVGTAGASAWHEATDLTIDDTARHDGLSVGSASTRARQSRTRREINRLGHDRAAEEYFTVLSLLPADSVGQDGHTGATPQSGCGSACDGQRRSYELPAEADAGAVDRVDADRIRHQVAIDYQGHCTSRGTIPGEAQRWAKRMTEPEIPWEPLLAQAVRRAVGWANGRTDYTWSRPSRRQSASPHVFMPGMRRPVPRVATIIDTSGSVDDTLLGKAMGEVEGALRGLGVAGAAVTVYACDADVGAVSRVRSARDASLVGGGGTDMRVGMAAAAADRPRPDVMIVFTDGYTPWPEVPPPGIAVVAAMLGRKGDPMPGTPAWATRIECVLV